MNSVAFNVFERLEVVKNIINIPCISLFSHITAQKMKRSIKDFFFVQCKVSLLMTNNALKKWNNKWKYD